jgi:hypothetical protein
MKRKILLIALLFLVQLSKAQNTCATALPITAGTFTVTAVDGTNISNATCSNAALAEWYVYTPTANYTVTITSDLIQNICKDTNFSIYTGTCAALNCFAQDDDAGIIACNVGNTNSYLSSKTFDVVAGTNYYIAWDNQWSALGFDFQLIQTPIVPTLCSLATVITAGTTTVSLVNDGNITTSCSTATKAKWFSYTPTQNYQVQITSDLNQNICKDTNFSIYTGSCTGVLTCVTSDDNSGNITCNVGNTNSFLSTKTFLVTAGTTYYIVWDNKWSDTGFDFQLIQMANPCTVATPITAGITTVAPLTGNNISTTCSTATKSKWYSYTPTQDFVVSISSDLIQNICKDTNFSVYTGSCTGVFTCVSSDDNSGSISCNLGNTDSLLSSKFFFATSGVTYFIVWDNKWSDAGFDFQLTESIIPRPVNYINQTITDMSTYNICVVDMNGDFKDDIVGISANNLRVHEQLVGGTYNIKNYPITGTSQLPSWSMAAGDYNRDGFNDLVLGSSGVSIWTSNNTGTAYTNNTPGQYIFCQRTNFADLNNDGNLDIFSCHDVAPNCYYLNDGAGNLTFYQSGVTPGAYNIGVLPTGGNYATLFTDFDNDGDTDVFISKCSGPPCELHRNDGAGVYTNISALAQINVTPIQTWSSAISDFDNDGDMDIIITASAGLHKFFKNNLDVSNATEEAFTNITAGSGWDTNTAVNIDNIAYDFDNDGFVDVMGSGNKIMYNQGNNSFVPVTYTAMSVGAVGDLNNDGFLDIQNGNIIRYAIPNGNNWIKVNLKGIQSNSNGIGARVEIYGAFGKQIRDIRSGEGFKYMSSLNAHFGIGPETEITHIIVRWPSGTRDIIFNPTINSSVLITEGAHPLAVNQIANSKFSIYPNPANDIINVKFNDSLTEIKGIEIYDLTGRLITDQKTNSSTVNIKKLAIGTYILMIKDENGNQFTEKFIKN